MVESPLRDFDDNPEWTEQHFATARPADEVQSPEVAASLVHPRAGTEGVLLELAPDVLDKFRATGPGWQARINEVLWAVRV